MFDGRDAADVRKWVWSQPRWWTRAVQVVCIDPHEGYRNAIRSLRSDGGLPATAGIAVDPFQVVGLANRALDDCRRRTQNPKPDTNSDTQR